jgi:putative ABC transport system permease protein
MLFLVAVYRGVADGSVEYIRHNKTDLWVLQRNSTNILRGSSLLTMEHGAVLREIPEVATVSPILLLLPALKKGDASATVFLAGYDPVTGIGGPPQITAGHAVESAGEIVLDRSFAARFHLRIGDSVQVQGETLRVVGMSTGTNAFVIQYAFVTLANAQSLMGFPGVVTCYLVKVNDGQSAAKVMAYIKNELPGFEVYDHETFLQNNIHEMETGFLTLLYAIAFLGTIVLTAILSLLLSISILERRKDFAVMKALGAPGGFLPGLIIQQALLISCIGILSAVILFFPMIGLIEQVAPEVSAKSSAGQILTVGAVVVLISLLSSFISLQRLRRIYPLEAFT